MHILILGAAGMIGRKLTARLAADGHLGGREITALTLADVVLTTAVPTGANAVACDLSQPGVAEALLTSKPDVIYHLAAIVSGEAEADLSKGYAINLGGTLNLTTAIAALENYCPRVVFTSSIAVFGAPLPDPVPDDHATLPLSSYGTQKAMGELLVSDLSRRGVLDGLSLRLPTICIRPGKPNAAASGFYSAILREPLIGQEATLPVPDSLRHWFASPRAATAYLVHAGALDTTSMGPRRALSLPGVSATIAEMIAALDRIAGPKATALIRRAPDENIAAIVAPWPQSFDPKRATDLGFRAETSIDDIIKIHIADELGGTIRLHG